MNNYFYQLKNNILTGRIKLSWKIFWMSFIAMFILVSLQLLGVKPPRLLSPLPAADVLEDTIRPKLEQVQNNYFLKEKRSIVPQAHAAGSYDNASAYVVVDYATGEIIAEKALSQKLPVASLTKVMTAMTALDLASTDEIFTVSANAASQIPTKIVLDPKERLTLGELLHASLLTSANDATQAIREGVDKKYQSSVFIRAMNAKALFLGLQNTHFANPQGFDNAENYSTVADLAILTHYALTNYQFISSLVQKDYAYIAASSNHKEYKLYNWNGLIGVYPNVSGMKIGNTDDAGKTTIVVSERSGQKILVVVLGAATVIERDTWAADLLDLGFEKTKGLRPIAVTEEQLYAKYAAWKY
ncbi:MAG: D-alanyl-D-alanine carboxypeptidase [Candidatus Levybacteria bacterium]|nr:D-alanyl-D-alanine carboxypeptidase [Candidatus Levybacteria bacterium]